MNKFKLNHIFLNAKIKVDTLTESDAVWIDTKHKGQSYRVPKGLNLKQNRKTAPVSVKGVLSLFEIWVCFVKLSYKDRFCMSFHILSFLIEFDRKSDTSKFNEKIISTKTFVQNAKGLGDYLKNDFLMSISIQAL